MSTLVAPSTARQRRRSSRSTSTAAFRSRSDRFLGLALTLPALAVFMVFTYYPFLRNFQIGLYQSPPFPGLPSKFVGTQQFTSMLSSPIFWDCVKTTALFVVFVVPLGVFGGLVMAVMAHQRLKGIQIYRTIFSSTVVSSAAVAALVFEAFVSPVNGYLRALGIHVSDLTVNPTWSLPVVALVSAWQFVGLAFIIFTAGLQSVPDDIMEAARVDGASSWTRLWRVTLPLLSPTVFFCIVVGVIFSLQSFGQIDIMVTSPNSAFAHTNVLIYYIYQLLRVQQNPGLAACYSVALFVITLVVTLIQFRLLEKRVHYGN